MEKGYSINDIRAFKDINNLEDYIEKEDLLKKVEIYSAVLLLLGSSEELKNDDNYNVAIHNYVLRIKEIIENYGYFSNGLYGGIVGVGFSILSISENGTKYQKLLSTINDIIFFETENKLKVAMENLNNVKELYYDVISGLAGDVAYLLNFKDDNKIRGLIKDCLDYLVLLTEDIEINSKKVPKFFIKSENTITEEDFSISKYGFINQGLAHGIPSILNILTLSLNNGIEVANQKKAMEKIVNILCKFRYNDGHRSWWYEHISFEQYVSEEKPVFMTRESWCYGTPGIARSLYMAGKALKNKEIENIGLKALEALALVGSERWGLDSVSLCHGYSSILVVMSVMYRETKKKEFEKAINESKDYILKDIQEGYKFKFKDYTFENIYDRTTEKCYKEDFSMLTGAIGVFLALGIVEKSNKYVERMLLID